MSDDAVLTVELLSEDARDVVVYQNPSLFDLGGRPGSDYDLTVFSIGMSRRF